MIRAMHRWPGLLAAIFVILLSLSGAALSVFPMAEKITAPKNVAGQTVGSLAQLVRQEHPGVEQILRAPSGRITVYWFDDGVPGSAVVDPASGAAVASADPNQLKRWLTNFHRSLFMEDGGRIAMATAAGAMLLLSLSGIVLIARRAGGWRRWFSSLGGPLTGRMHSMIARVTVVFVALACATSLWMTASTFDLLPFETAYLPIPDEVSGDTGVALSDLEMLDRVPVTQLRTLSFPYSEDATDVFTLKTNQGFGYLDQGTGVLLGWVDLTLFERLSETVYMLHTGVGASGFGLWMGLMSLGVPALAITGTLIWAAGRQGRPRLRNNASAGRAETVVLVGSEGGSTWGFATTLQNALGASGQAVHMAALSSFAPEKYSQARRILILAATYGDGDTPSSAKGFLEKLEKAAPMPEVSMAVLGFGDRSFPAYCSYAQAVADKALARGWSPLMPFDTVDRQSPQDFARWGRALGRAMGQELELLHQPVVPKSQKLTLVSRRDYGVDVNAPTAVLRFALPSTTWGERVMGKGFARFGAGDLLGVLPDGSAVPRLYSMASARSDGFVEIVVKQHPNGLCSSQLMALKSGDTIEAFLRPNPAFHPCRTKAPLILIGAGTGVGPLAGFVRDNAKKRPIHLFFGMRDPRSDFLYGEDFPEWESKGHLSRIVTAVSRSTQAAYVQDAVRAEQGEIIQLIGQGARIMVCGGRDMANGVADALAEILIPAGLTPNDLKAAGRYVEDVY